MEILVIVAYITIGALMGLVMVRYGRDMVALASMMPLLWPIVGPLIVYVLLLEKLGERNGR